MKLFPKSEALKNAMAEMKPALDEDAPAIAKASYWKA
jgi:hypothetical protein